MPNLVVNGAPLMCTMGVAPGTLQILPTNMVNGPSTQPAATVQDMQPMMNIMPFGMCMSPSNPEVAAATAAALGVLTPMPCVPATPAPWVTGAPTVLLAEFPTLDDISEVMCIWGGVITFSDAGEETVNVP